MITVEFPHLLRLIEANYFDTIYHEHYSYLSLLAVERLFARHGLELFDLEELTTHGGSLRIFAGHTGAHPGPSGALAAFRAREAAAGLDDLAAYAAFADNVRATKRALLELLIRMKNDGKSIAAYGAPAKGNTLLNYCGIRTDFIDLCGGRQSGKAGDVPARNRGASVRARAYFRDPARLSPDPALEPEGRDHGPDGRHPRLGRPGVKSP